MDNVLILIDECYDSFSKMHKKFADYILENYEKAILMSMNKISQESGVSEATIIRFTYRLGFDGYKDFQKSLINSTKYSLTTLQRFTTMSELSNADLINSSFHRDVTDINNTFLSLKPEVLNKAVDLIEKSKTIYILGLRTSTILSNYLAYYMRLLCFNVILVESTQMEPFEQLMNITEDDTLIAITFPRYSRKTIETIKLIRDKNCKIISITDSDTSPLNRYSDVSLIAYTSMTSFIDSLVSPLSLVNTFLLALSNINSKDVKSTFAKLEELWEKQDTYEKI